MAYGTLPGSVLIQAVTLTRPVHSYASGTKQPIVTETLQATGIRTRIEPLSGRLQETVLGRIPSATHRLFTNRLDVRANDLITEETSGQTYVVHEVSNFFGHHIEAILEAKND
ncbi:MAG: hypothetical protein Q8R01_10445 [Ramlibacter sp.]|nr:hypothetical protein [Ramlibacter sp.]